MRDVHILFIHIPIISNHIHQVHPYSYPYPYSPSIPMSITYRCDRGHLPLQLPGHDSVVDVSGEHGVRQHHAAEALGEGSRRSHVVG